MLLSMTGQGQGRRHHGASEISVEMRAVNNRHLKIQLRTSEGLGQLEPQIESLLRGKLHRGSLQVSVQLSGADPSNTFRINEQAVAAYVSQCNAIAKQVGIPSQISIADLLTLPGVIPEASRSTSSSSLNQEPPTDEVREAVLAAVGDAIDCLNRMRSTEGRSMESELLLQLEKLVQLAEQIEKRAPNVLEDYKDRLTTKLKAAVEEVNGVLQESDVVREVLIMADKSDIREELVRLRSHLEQFKQLLQSDQSQGRKLDFLIQEMFRETNTIGSKAGDAEIAQRVVDVKSVIEQMRELVQNVE